MSRHEAANHGRAIVLYGIASLIVLAIGVVAIWSFVERQSIRRTLAPEPLPEITILTSHPDSTLAAGWVDLLTRAQFSPTLVSFENFVPSDGVFAIVGVDRTTPGLERAIADHLAARGGIAVLGSPPAGSSLGFKAPPGPSGETLRLAEASSPVLARVRPGHQLSLAPHEAALLEESPSMNIDARWEGSSRAAIAHWSHGGGRVLFFGFDPSALWHPADEDLLLLLRTAFRWVASQPVSDAAIGMPAAAKTLTAASRIRAQNARLAWSFDRLESEGEFVLRIRNGSREALENPTVKIWYPETISSLELSGALFGRRNVNLDITNDRAAIVSLTSLRAHEDRYIPITGTPAPPP